MVASYLGLTPQALCYRPLRRLKARDLLADLAAQTTQATTERENADDAALDAAKLMANGVRADPQFGEDRALYEGIGYTRTSERKSGLHRTKGSKKGGGGTGGGGTPPAKPVVLTSRTDFPVCPS